MLNDAQRAAPMAGAAAMCSPSSSSLSSLQQTASASSSSSTLAVPQNPMGGGAESMPMKSTLTVVPEDLPAIKYRHTMVLISRGIYSRKIEEMVCNSHEAMEVAHSRAAGQEDEEDDESPKNEHSAATTEGSNNSNSPSSVAATDGTVPGTTAASAATTTTATSSPDAECRCRRRKTRKEFKKCYCSLSRSLSAYSLQQQQQSSSLMQRQGTGPWPYNPSISSSGLASPSCAGLARSVTSESGLSLQDRATTSLDLRRGCSGSMAVISRIAFESVSHKYSSTIPKLTSFSAAINTCLIFVLAGDLPPSGTAPWTPSASLLNRRASGRTPGSSASSHSSSQVDSDVSRESSASSGVNLGICRVSAVEGVECGCFPLFGGHKKRSGGANRNSSDNQHRRSGSEVEVQDDERIEDDLRMLELRLRQWQRQRQHLDEDSKPLAVLLVISDFDRKMDIDRREHIFTKDEKQDLKNRHTLLSASVDSLWDKWGPRGENILDDKVTTSWDGDKLHSVITDLSTRLAHAYTTTARLPEDAT